jgi:hypothetical protein
MPDLRLVPILYYLLTCFGCADFKIVIFGKMSELDGTDTRDDIFYRPLTSQNVKKFEA